MVLHTHAYHVHGWDNYGVGEVCYDWLLVRTILDLMINTTSRLQVANGMAMCCVGGGVVNLEGQSATLQGPSQW